MTVAPTAMPMKAETMTTASPTPAAERMRRHRERRREGFRCLYVDLHDDEVDALIRKGFLKPEMRNDRNAIALALYEFLDASLEPAA